MRLHTLLRSTPSVTWNDSYAVIVGKSSKNLKPWSGTRQHTWNLWRSDGVIYAHSLVATWNLLPNKQRTTTTSQSTRRSSAAYVLSWIAIEASSREKLTMNTCGTRTASGSTFVINAPSKQRQSPRSKLTKKFTSLANRSLATFAVPRLRFIAASKTTWVISRIFEPFNLANFHFTCSLPLRRDTVSVPVLRGCL